MKRFVRLVCLLLVFASMAAIPAYAQEATSRASDYISSYRAYCTKNSTGTISVSYQVIGTRTMDKIGATTIKVQYSSDQVNWSTAKTFNSYNYSSMMDTNSAFHGGVVTCTVPTGMYYRAYVVFYCAKDNGIAQRYYYTDII